MYRGQLSHSGRLDMHNLGLQTSRHLMYGGYGSMQRRTLGCEP